jgi:hypothetical protein
LQVFGEINLFMAIICLFYFYLLVLQHQIKKRMTSLQINTKELLALKKAKEIDDKDITAASITLAVSKTTIYRYLKGEGTSPNTAYDLAHFFTKRRDARLNGTKKITAKSK